MNAFKPPKPAAQIEPEFEQEYSAWKADPSPKTTGALLRKLDPVIDAGVKNYGLGSSGPALKGRARRITLQALSGYDPARGRLKGYLNSHLQGLRRIATHQTAAISLPEQVMLDQQHLFEAEQRLRDDLGRPPSDLELSDETGLSMKRLAHVRSMTPAAVEGQLRAPGEDGTLEHFAPAALVPGQDSGDNAWLDLVYRSLPPTDQVIFEHHFGWNGKPVLEAKEVAKMLRVTPARISQKKAEIQRLIDSRGELGGI